TKMVSRTLNVSAAAVTRLSAPTPLPSVIALRLGSAGAGGGSAAGGGGAGSSFLPQATSSAPMSPRAAKLSRLIVMSGLRSWYREDPTRLDQVWVLDAFLVRFVDLLPLTGIAILRLGDLGKAVALLHGVGPHFACRLGCGAGRAAFDIIKLSHVTLLSGS